METQAKVDEVLRQEQRQGHGSASVIVRLNPGTERVPRVPGLTVQHHLTSVSALAGQLDLACLDEAAAVAEVVGIEADSEATVATNGPGLPGTR